MTRALVLVALLVSLSGALSAAPNCPANTTDLKSGRVEPGGDPVTFAIDLKPCQTLSITVESSTPTPRSIALVFQLLNEAKQNLWTDNWSVPPRVTKAVAVGAPWMPPYRGTRGPGGLPKYATLKAPSFSAGTYVDYTVRIVKTRREHYNEGGDSFDSAPATDDDRTYAGSIHPFDPGQFFKVTLGPKESLSVKGKLLAHEAYSAYFEINIYDARRNPVRRLVFGNTTRGGLSFQSQPFINGLSKTAEYYVKLSARYWPIHDFRLSIVRQKPRGR